MLDLKSLEKELDNALEMETRESLSNWLSVRRIKNFFSKLGDGVIKDLEPCNLGVVTEKSHIIVNNDAIDIHFLNYYNTAA